MISDAGEQLQVFPRQTMDTKQPQLAHYYRNTTRQVESSRQVVGTCAWSVTGSGDATSSPNSFKTLGLNFNVVCHHSDTQSRSIRWTDAKEEPRSVVRPSSPLEHMIDVGNVGMWLPCRHIMHYLGAKHWLAAKSWTLRRADRLSAASLCNAIF